ncbi:MAG: ATP-binding protein [Pseudomonadota bacterium]
MKLNSLALRLFLSAAVWALLALPIAGLLLTSLFRAQAERDFDIRLANLLPLLISSSVSSSGDIVKPRQFGDELFQFPGTGWYWQIVPTGARADAPVRVQYVSESLTDTVLDVDFNQAIELPDQQFRFQRMTGPGGKPLRVISQIFPPPGDDLTPRYLFTVTGSLGEVDSVVADFARTVTATFAALAIGLIVAIFFQVLYGLRPLKRIERGLAQIRAGDAERLDADMPVEIEPLQDEINKLIASNHEIVERARTHVGNLAHALKTPLAVITNEARGGNGPLAEKVSEQAQIMRTQVDLYLDRARMVARSGVISDVTPVAPVVDALARALMRIHEDKGVQIAMHCDDDLRFQGEKQDLEELLGNLMDNASKWAAEHVKVTAKPDAPASQHTGKPKLVITIDDDGPGLTKAQRKIAAQRGLRLDESTPGSGFGLSIVRDLVELYEGSFELKRADLGGLRVRVRLPRVL